MKRPVYQALERKRIVLVDDDGDYRELVRDWLAPRYDTVSCQDGEELLDELSIAQPDLIVLDIGLPGPDGLHLCHRLRSDSRFAGIPIVFLTGSKADQDFVRGLEAGAFAYLTKPVERVRLLAKIREILEEPD